MSRIVGVINGKVVDKTTKTKKQAGYIGKDAPKDLEDMSKAELADLAKSKGVDVKSTMSKPTLIDAIKAAEAVADDVISEGGEEGAENVGDEGAENAGDDDDTVQD